MTALIMFVLIASTTCITKRPEDISKMSPREYSILKSGLPPKGDLLLRRSIFIAITCIGALFLYSYKLDKSLTCENDVHRLRYCWRIYNFLLFAAMLLPIAQIILALFGLFKVEHISISHIFFSRIFDGLMILLIFISFFLFTRKYIKAIQNTPPSVILAAKQKVRTSNGCSGSGIFGR